MGNFFEDAFLKADSESKESFYRTVFMNDDSEYAHNLRLEFYSKKLKSMGKNVSIGKGVKIVNPQFIELGDDVKICDHCTLIARGEGGIVLEDSVILNDRVY